jgi:tetratricopeptide (TPR) repeat protein
MPAATSYKEIIAKAKEAEEQNDLKNAITFYRQAVKKEPANEYAYNRLMILYRRLKQYKEELRVINEGLKFFKDFYESKSNELSGENKKIIQLSNALMKSVGLKNKKGVNLYYPEPVPTWEKRKQVVDKKIKSM